MVVCYMGFLIDSEIVKMDDQLVVLVDNNLLGKILVLFCDDGLFVFDSWVIMQFLDCVSGGKFYLVDLQVCIEVEVLEVLVDGIMDCLIVYVYECCYWLEEKIYQFWFDK